MNHSEKFDYGVMRYFPDEKFPPDFRLREVAGVLQTAFRSVGRRVIDQYFDEGSHYYPHDLEFVVEAARNTKAEPLVGTIIARLLEINGLSIIYYDKVGVTRRYQSNGVSAGMFQLAAEAGQNREITIAALRTSIPSAHERYWRRSDITDFLDPYHIHGFGLLDKETGQELIPDARSIFKEITRHIASLPPTTVLLKSS